MSFATTEQALRDINLMFSLYDKKLFITLYGDLISKDYKKRVNNNEDIEKIFKELCKELLEEKINKKYE